MPRIIDKGVSQHKRLACGDTVKGYKQGGKVNVGQPITVRAMIKLPASPLTMARRNNGVRGMKTGGKVSK